MIFENCIEYNIFCYIITVVDINVYDKYHFYNVDYDYQFSKNNVIERGKNNK